jgi:hypothetical protein
MVTVLTEASVYKSKDEVLQAQRNNKLLFKELNRGFIEPLDRNVFKKTVEDRNEMYSLRTKWKKDMEICFPILEERKKNNNPICK